MIEAIIVGVISGYMANEGLKSKGGMSDICLTRKYDGIFSLAKEIKENKNENDAFGRDE